MVHIIYPTGVLDIRTNRVYSEVYCKERFAKYFIPAEVEETEEE